MIVRPLDAVSLDEAHAALELWEFYSGKVADPSQRLAVELMMAEDASGRWAARTTGREMPRQNGKGDEIEIVELWGLVMRGEAILHTAHEIPTVASAHERMFRLLDGHPDLRRRVVNVLNGDGKQKIELSNDSVITYRTRTNSGGRGLDDISRLVIDEAQEAQPEQLASMTPTLFANPNPQMNFVGTGATGAKSKWWWEQRIRAISPDPGQFAYLGHTIERISVGEDGELEHAEFDVEDRDEWLNANPALWTDRGDIEFLEEQFRTLGPDRFAREHLCVWDPLPAERGSTKLDADRWRLAADVGKPIVGPVALAVDCGFDLAGAAIVASGRRVDGLRLVEVVETAPGTAWLETKLATVLDAQPDVGLVAVDASGPARALVPMLERVTTERDLKLKKLSGAEYAASCASFDAAVPDELRHLGDARLSNPALNTASRRYSDGWVWDRRHGDISALAAATVAFSVADGLPTSARRSVYEDRGLEVV